MLSPKQIQDRDRRLDALAKYISVNPMTADQISAREGCTKATAYAWIKILLKERKIRLSGKIRGTSGGWASVYGAVVTR